MNTNNKLLIAVIAGISMIAGLAGGSLLKVRNADAENIITADNQPGKNGNFDPSKGGHTANGKTEELLTGDNADKAKVAALKAVPGGTIQRVETDAEGDVYEAHMLDTNGSPVTVKFDGNFGVTKTESGPKGHGPVQTN